MTDSGGELQWYFSQVKGTMDDEVNEADIISTVEFSDDGELLATGDKGGRIVIFQREQPHKAQLQQQSSASPYFRTDYNVYSTFQSHEAEFDYLKSLEIEEKINKIKWLRRKNIAHFLLSTNDKTVKLWKIRERNKRIVSDMNGHVSVRDDMNGYIRNVSIPVVKYMDRTEVEAIPKRIFANAHTYHINSISLNSDQETFMSADDLRINLWHIDITNQSFNIVDIKPANMEELSEVITAAEFHPKECNLFVYSSSKGIIRLCDMRQSALCDTQAKIFEEREDPTTKNFFSEIISSISDVKFSHSGRYLCTRDYLHVKIWDLNMENRPVETYCVHDYLRNKLCILYENDCIFDKFECNWSSNDDYILSGSYHNFFKSFNRSSKQEAMFECSRENSKARQQLKPKRVINQNLNNANNANTNGSASPLLNSKRNAALNGKAGAAGGRDEINVDNLDFTKKILHTSWHPKDNLIAIAATNNLYIFYGKDNYAPMNMTTNATHVSTTNSIAQMSMTAAAGSANSNPIVTPASPAGLLNNGMSVNSSANASSSSSSSQSCTSNTSNSTSSTYTSLTNGGSNGLSSSSASTQSTSIVSTSSSCSSNLSCSSSQSSSLANGNGPTNGLGALANSTNIILNNILPLSSSPSSSSPISNNGLNSSFYSTQSAAATAAATPSMSI